MSKRILKEMIRRLNILSYNDHDIVESTWDKKDNNGNSIIKGYKKVPKTFEEDLEMSSEEFCDEKIKNTFIYPKDIKNSFDIAGSEYDDSDSNDDIESESSEIPIILFNKTKKPKELII